MSFRELIDSHFRASIKTKETALSDPSFLAELDRAGQALISVYQNGKKTLIAGNGGSAADAQHMAAELVGRFYFDRPALPSIALTTDTSALTAIGNDYGFESLFSRQVEALGQKGDVFIALSTSGNSPNVLRAIESARARGLICIGLTGQSGGKMASECDVCLRVPSTDTPRIQETHILVIHILCDLVEKELFKSGKKS